MREIILNCNKVAIVDDEDFERISALGKWFATTSDGVVWYARRNVGHAASKSGKITTELMHHIVIGKNDEGTVDHRDGDGLNNTRANLRHSTYSENVRNKRMPRNNKSGVLGVYWCPLSRKWKARIGFRGKHFSLGYFDSIDDASAARSAAELRLWGHNATRATKSR